MRSLPPTMLNTHPNTSSLWHTPIPYLFVGLTAIMGLIALALLALACSYCSNNEDKESESQTKEPVQAYEEKILVIMAGNEKPTFLATPRVLSIYDGDIDNHVPIQEN
ncbi:protein GLUTAMINE DUMPER 5-like [Lathyrus oleraceus]|uniref:protein GLUTAMINE DUMPER 5-like n=1 Tax=Pisum sativum TaxID=3888 RepID=UPI0021D0E26C|nr:protein GLUTAMINE DUMPER 5-like [Pisum sativum]